MLIFAENLNDSRAIRELVLLHKPDLGASIRPIQDPPSLTRHAGLSARKSWVERVDAAVRAAVSGGTHVRAVLIHQDSDGVDEGPSIEKRIADDFRALAGTVDGVPVVPVTMIEAWWLLFPDALASVRTSWRGAVSTNPGMVDQLADPKRDLKRLTRRVNARHEYRELDSPAIASKIRELRLQPSGTSPSYDRFVDRVQAL